MAREFIDLDDAAVPVEPLSVEEARAMRGQGWHGDLDSMRESRLA